MSICSTFILLYLLKPAQLPKQVSKTSAPTAPKETQLPRELPTKVAFSVPSRLLIENIKVEASVKPVGLTPEGDMAIDENPEETAWYELGPKPGEEGSAVVAGHYGWKNGQGSVFNELHTLKVGDLIAIVDDKGQKVTFSVTRMQMYAPDQDATDVFKSDDGKAHLNLITCHGDWNSKLSTYSQRLVVFTDFVKAEQPV